MKKIITAMLALAMMFGVCACSKGEEPAKKDSVAKTETVKVAEKEESKKAEETQIQEPVTKPATKEEASAFIGQSAEELEKTIGEPKSKTYASSCIGDGEDGEWYYDGFTVYTYREAGKERVEDVF